MKWDLFLLENHDRLLNESIDFWDYSMLIHIKAKYILDISSPIYFEFTTDTFNLWIFI
jgi:hypothetical protein